LKIAVAISGGVDSVRAAVLLQEQGHDVFGIHMRLLPLPGDVDGTAEIIAEREVLLRGLAAHFDIPLTMVDLRKEFESRVITPFIEAYQGGMTPNPCITCNPAIKFGLLLSDALGCGAERLATGHYARLSPPGGAGADRYQLHRAEDRSKDQSYFLMGLSQEQLARAVFPLGTTSKRETLAWAERSGIKQFLTEDSQEICFILSGKYPEFVRKRAGLKALSGGPILDMDGNRLGEHKGIYSYTVGQRRGLGIASSEPYYVTGIEPATNTVRVGRAKDLVRGEFMVTGLNWVSVDAPTGPIECEARIRNLHAPSRAEVTPLGANTASVRFNVPQRAVTPGQAAVFYSGDLLLGGGTIALPS